MSYWHRHNFRKARTIVKRKYLTKKNSTRAERVFAQALTELRVPFEHRVQIQAQEVDFIFNEYAVEIDGHEQDPYKNFMLLEAGYAPLHLSNAQLKDVNSTKLWLQTLLTN